MKRAIDLVREQNREFFKTLDIPKVSTSRIINASDIVEPLLEQLSKERDNTVRVDNVSNITKPIVEALDNNNKRIDNLDWEFDVPTGNISTKTMTISVWCKINSATYYAGTHQLPRLTIDYDNGTIAYAQASETTDWQLIYLAFTPTTTYGQVTVTLSARTDQTTTNAYVYFDDFTVAYPPSVALDLGGMDNWANALPVTPPIALPISAGTVAQSVWTQLTTTDWGTNSMGESLKSTDWETALDGDGLIINND